MYQMFQEKEKINVNPLLENWKYWIAREVVASWLDASCLDEQQNEDDFSSIKLTNTIYLSNIINNLKSTIDKIREQISSSGQLAKIDNNLKQNFEQVILKRLQEKNHQLRGENVEILGQLSSRFLSASPSKAIKFYSDLLQNLYQQKTIQDQISMQYLRNEKSSAHAYYILRGQMENTVDNSIDFRCLKESTSNALSISFQAKLEAENSSASIQSILSLIQLGQLYLDSANNSYAMLKNIEKSLESKASIEITSIPIFSHLKLVDAEKQKLLMESWVGHSLLHWGNAPVSWQQIEAKLLENIEPIAFDIYKDFRHVFHEHSKIDQN